MRFADKYKITEGYENLFSFTSEEAELEHESRIIMFKFLKELDVLSGAGRKLKIKDLAIALDKSPSFISQLYSGEKLLSLKLLAKIQKAFDITFEIKAIPNTLNYSEMICESKPSNKMRKRLSDKHNNLKLAGED